eukprot:TRINITY_DN73956_c0_g1_i1.p1 TRINITY_DN73956_c0_g1~~TRINITY_DN73956_c0_g1_i1.p1  ORF type:complete len:200 (-),score=40.72 TRINITY_DN73956_c0_g1_i1:45-644(-)
MAESTGQECGLHDASTTSEGPVRVEDAFTRQLMALARANDADAADARVDADSVGQGGVPASTTETCEEAPLEDLLGNLLGALKRERPEHPSADTRATASTHLADRGGGSAAEAATRMNIDAFTATASPPAVDEDRLAAELRQLCTFLKKEGIGGGGGGGVGAPGANLAPVDEEAFKRQLMALAVDGAEGVAGSSAGDAQ